MPDQGQPIRPARPAVTRAGWGDLRLRIASALVLVPLTLTALWLGGPAWWLLLAVAGGLLATEWLGMCRALPRRWGLKLAGLPYFLIPFASLVLLRAAGPIGRSNMLFLLFVVWASDVGAYLAGRAFGGPRLAPAISPGKTWSGAAGGIAATVLMGLLAWLLVPGSLARACALAVLLGLAAQLGDLLESLLKRAFGVKDSGRLIPGHGGLLDRVDGLLLAAPIAAAAALILGTGRLLWN